MTASRKPGARRLHARPKPSAAAKEVFHRFFGKLPPIENKTSASDIKNLSLNKLKPLSALNTSLPIEPDSPIAPQAPKHTPTAHEHESHKPRTKHEHNCAFTFGLGDHESGVRLQNLLEESEDETEAAGTGLDETDKLRLQNLLLEDTSEEDEMDEEVKQIMKRKGL